MKFTELKLNKKLQQGIEDAGFVECMPVQEQTFTHTFKGKDVYVQSQTGTGKTAAFLITIFNIMIEQGPENKNKALIVAPVRELAEQIGLFVVVVIPVQVGPPDAPAVRGVTRSGRGVSVGP